MVNRSRKAAIAAVNVASGVPTIDIVAPPEFEVVERLAMSELHYFEYHTPAREAGITDEQLQLIEQMFRADYPKDDMLFELHVLRVCNSVRDGRADLNEILDEAKNRRSDAA